MRPRKAMSQAMWVVVAILVAFIVALILMTIFGGTTNKAGKQTDTSINDSGSGMDAQTCLAICQSCQMTYGTDCNTGAPPTHWTKMKGTCTNPCT